jgi:hypothetical protein
MDEWVVKGSVGLFALVLTGVRLMALKVLTEPGQGRP